MNFYKVLLKTICISILLLMVHVSSRSIQAQSNTIKFSHITVDEGLSQSTVFAIEQDSRGFMWFGTRTGGLNRYDGSLMKVYKNNTEDPYSISGNEVQDIMEDSKGRIWIGTRNAGISRFDFEQERFYSYLHLPRPGNSRDYGTVTAIVEDYKGRIWTATLGGLFFYDNEADDFFQVINKVDGKAFKGISSLCLMQDSLLCIGTKRGAIIFNANNLYVLKTFKHEPGNSKSLSSDNVRVLHFDHNNYLWIGTRNHGLNLIKDINDGDCIHFQNIKSDNTSLSDDVIRTIYTDENSFTWIGTSYGLNKLLPSEIEKPQPKFIRFLNDPLDKRSLAQNVMFSFCEDHSGNFWIGTWSKGVDYLDVNSKKFDHFKFNKDKALGLRHDVVNCFTENEFGIWVGTNGGGVSLFDRSKNRFLEHINSKETPGLVSNDKIKSLYADDDHTIWVGTFEGLTHYNCLTKTSVKYFQKYVVNGVIPSVYDELWLATSQGIIKFNKKDKTYSRYLRDNLDTTSLADNNINILYADVNNDIWVGTKKGLHLYNREQDNFIRYQHSITDNNSLGNNYVIAINNDDKGNLWVGTYNGLNKFNPIDQTFTRYNEIDDLPDNVIEAILPCENDRLWFSTSKGLSRVDFTGGGKGKMQVRNYTKEDGLQGEEYLLHSSFKTASGELMFGGIFGFNIFNPDSIKDNENIPKVVITDLKLFNKSVSVQDEGTVLTKHIALTEHITLSYKQTVVTFCFAALNFTSPERNKFAYYLEGFEKDWNYVEDKKEASYTNMPAGEYVFRVKAANNDGIWNEEGTSIKLIVRPPWWATWWFRMIIALFIVALLLGIYYYRLHSIYKQNHMLEGKVRQRTLELLAANDNLKEKQEEVIAQNDELECHRNNLESLVKDRTTKLELALELAKESDKLKSAFLANISHEIRTPMNAISGFSQLLRSMNVTIEERKTYTNIIQTNSNDLLRIIDEILDLSLIESRQLKIVNQNFNLNVFIDQIFSYYHLVNANRKVDIRLNNELEKSNLVVCSDESRLKQIVNNFMDNACKFTSEGYVELGVYQKEESLCLYVKDTGKGIPNDRLNHVFKQFTKVEYEKGEWIQGIGLGLAISQEISTALGGDISVESVEGEGSKFTFSFPVSFLSTSEGLLIEEVVEPGDNNWEEKTILIAEDVTANYQYLRRVLEKTKITVLWAKDGSEAVDIISSNKDVDMILMDIKMPGMDGYKAAEIIKAKNKDIVIVAQTAYARAEERHKFYNANFSDYLAKPIAVASLRLVLQKYL